MRIPLVIPPDGPWEVMGERMLFTRGKKKGGDIRKHDQGTDFLLVGLDDL